MKKFLALLLLILLIVTSQLFSSFQMKNADKITNEQIQFAVKAHNSGHYEGE